MAKVPMRASASEMLEVLNKQWLDTKDIKILACVSYKKAREIKNEISKKLIAENYFLPSGLVPSENVTEYLKLNIKYLRKIANEKVDSGGKKNEKD